jgi:hypothetical protein
MGRKRDEALADRIGVPLTARSESMPSGRGVSRDDRLDGIAVRQVAATSEGSPVHGTVYGGSETPVAVHYTLPKHRWDNWKRSTDRMCQIHVLLRPSDKDVLKMLADKTGLSMTKVLLMGMHELAARLTSGSRLA